jgi:hypothetical protein
MNIEAGMIDHSEITMSTLTTLIARGLAANRIVRIGYRYTLPATSINEQSPFAIPAELGQDPNILAEMKTLPPHRHSSG